MAKVNLMTQKEYAAHRKCSAVAVCKAVKAGRITLINGLIDPTVADIQWKANSRARAPSRQPDTPATAVAPDAREPEAAPPLQLVPDDGYMLNRARREAAEANMAEMKEAEMRGRYLQKDVVDAVIFEIARSLRDGLTNCSRRIAADVASLVEVEACEAVIEREHRALLDSMWHSLTSKLDVPAEGALSS